MNMKFLVHLFIEGAKIAFAFSVGQSTLFDLGATSQFAHPSSSSLALSIWPSRDLYRPIEEAASVAVAVVEAVVDRLEDLCFGDLFVLDLVAVVDKVDFRLPS